MNSEENNEVVPNYWYVEGKAYDFSTFEHPGGPIAISLGKGRDATQLFHSYHPFTPHIRSILNKYQVPRCDDFVSSEGTEPVPGESPESSPRTTTNAEDDCVSPTFVWTEKGSDFFNELRQEVKIKLAGRRHANTARWLQILAMVVLVVALFPSFVSGSWLSLIAFPLAYWVLGVNTFHDASHFSLHKDWRVNHYLSYLFPCFSSPFTWYHQHVIGHHVYTNTPQDPDMHHGRKFWRYSPDREYRSFFKYQMYYFWLIWTQVTMFLAFVLDTTFMIRGHYERIHMIEASTSRKVIHVLGRVFTFSYIYVWPFFMPHFSWIQSIVWSIVPYAIFSTCFSISSQLNHITDENMHEKAFPDWYEHQVATSHTFAPKSMFWYIFTGGLNLQIEHHLFPGLNSWHLRDIQPIVQATCKKHNVHYNVSHTIGEALRKHFNHLSAMSKPIQN